MSMSKLNYNGKSGQLRRTSFEVISSDDSSPLAMTRPVVSDLRTSTRLMYFIDTSFNDRHYHKTSRSTESNAALWSRNTTIVGRRKVCLFSTISWGVDIWSIHLRSCLKPARCSQTGFSRALVELWTINEVNILYTILVELTPLWLSPKLILFQWNELKYEKIWAVIYAKNLHLWRDH